MVGKNTEGTENKTAKPFVFGAKALMSGALSLRSCEFQCLCAERAKSRAVTNLFVTGVDALTAGRGHRPRGFLVAFAAANVAFLGGKKGTARHGVSGKAVI
jgi:hypothetical protein